MGPKGSVAAGTSHGMVFIWDSRARIKASSYDLRKGICYVTSLSLKAEADGSKLAVGLLDGRVLIWDLSMYDY